MKKMPTFCPELPNYRAPPGWPAAAWPIEWFRDNLLIPGASEPTARTFLSSGTTSGTRSKSPFSKTGLEFYRVASLNGFNAVLEAAGIAGAPGISLIPTVKEWPDSSLAQMMAWIAEGRPVTYAGDGPIDRLLNNLNPATPVWLFGTAFHLVELIDRTDASGGVKLPAGSKVFETGGTKGKSRTISREELYAALADRFGIGTTDIISEYGMCELASQAYDVADGRQRRFRFPPWVRVGVVTRPGTISPSGEGALVVFDSQRVDVPHPIRTEDLVALDADGGFRLLGRLGGAPLRGCSLRVEETVASKPIARHRVTAISDLVSVSTNVATLERATKVARVIRECFLDRPTRMAFARELGSDAAAAAAIDDLFAAIPEDPAAWVIAAQHAVGAAAPKRWLFVLPDNHALVGVPAIALGVVAGLDLQVRLPQSMATTTATLALFVIAMQKIDPTLRTLPPTWRVGDSCDRGDYDAVLAFGGDDSINAIRTASGKPTQGFGNRFGVSVLTAKELSAAALVRDAFGLGQRGCMSTRAALVLGAHAHFDPEVFAQTLANAAIDFWATPLAPSQRAALDVERCRYERLGCRVFVPSDNRAPLIAIQQAPGLRDLLPLGDFIATRPHVLPIAIVEEDSDSFVKTGAAWLQVPEVGTVTASPYLVPKLADVVNSRLRTVSLRDLGAAQRPLCNGFHEGKPLFTLPV